jgi:hypothetical protein
MPLEKIHGLFRCPRCGGRKIYDCELNFFRHLFLSRECFSYFREDCCAAAMNAALFYVSFTAPWPLLLNKAADGSGREPNRRLLDAGQEKEEPAFMLSDVHSLASYTAADWALAWYAAWPDYDFRKPAFRSFGEFILLFRQRFHANRKVAAGLGE